MHNTDKLAQLIADALKNNGITEYNMDVPVGVSARHIHLSREHVEALFGSGYMLTKKQVLMGGQFAAAERVTIIGAGLRSIENVRVLGPERPFSQVEISATDSIKLGTKAPMRESGNLSGSAPITIVGPKGSVFLQEGCIIAARHIHMPPAEAEKFGVRDGDMVSVEVDNERGVVLKKIKIRVHESFTTEMHIDTDEANACFLKTGDNVKILT